VCLLRGRNFDLTLLRIRKRTLESRTMVQTASRRRLTAEARARSPASPCEFGGGKSDTGTGFYSINVFPVSIVPPMICTHLQLYVAFNRANGRSLGTFQKATLFQESWIIGKKSTRSFTRSSSHIRCWSAHI